MLSKYQAGAHAWRLMKEIIEAADMSEAVPADTEDRDQIIEAIYTLAKNFEEHAAELEHDERFLERKRAKYHAEFDSEVREESAERRRREVQPRKLVVPAYVTAQKDLEEDAP